MVERSLWEREVAGSNPVIPTFKKVTNMKLTLKQLFENNLDLKTRWSANNPDSLLGTTIGSNKEAKWFCPVCKQETITAINKKVKKPDICQVCSGQQIISGVNDFLTRYPNLADQWSNNNSLTANAVSPSSSYVAEWVCADDDTHVWKTTVAERTRTVKSTHCPFCSKQKRIADKVQPNLLPDGENIPVELKKMYSSSNEGTYTLASKQKCLWECPLGHTWEASPFYMRKNLSCAQCSTVKNSLSHTHPHLISEWADDKKTPEQVSYGSAYQATWKCFEGHTWTAAVYSRTLSESGCPTCFSFVSKAEDELYDFLKTLTPEQIIRHNRNIIYPYELDIYIPHLNLAVEFNGLYWHSEEQGKNETYHISKYLTCKKQNIELIQIWEDDWKFKLPIIQRLLEEKIKPTQVPVQDLQVKPISETDSEQFIVENQLQIFDKRANLHLGIFSHNKIEAVITFKKTDSKSLTILQYAGSQFTETYFNIFLDHVKSFNYKQILVFTDNCFNQNFLYKNAGFVEIKTINPKKYIVSKRKRWLAPENVETQLPVIWDAGSTKWVKNF